LSRFCLHLCPGSDYFPAKTTLAKIVNLRRVATRNPLILLMTHIRNMAFADLGQVSGVLSKAFSRARAEEGYKSTYIPPEGWGIDPSKAKEHHEKNADILIEKALKEAHIEKPVLIKAQKQVDYVPDWKEELV